MRKLDVVLAALLFVRPSGAEQRRTGYGLDVGIVLDLCIQGDKSLQNGAYVGAARPAGAGRPHPPHWIEG